MCSGMAIVVSDKILGDSCAALKEGNCGFILPHAIDPFVEKICWIIEHPEYFDRIIHVNRRLMYPRTMAATAEMYNNFFSRI